MAQEDRHENVRKAQLVHIITLLELGGAQENTLANCRLADRELFEVSLVSGSGGVLDDEALIMEHINFYRVKELVREIHPLKDIISLAKIVFFLKKVKRKSPGQPVIVHTHSSKAGIIGRLAAALAGCEIVVHTVHGFGFTPLHSPLFRRFLVLLERAVSSLTDVFVLVSRKNGSQGERLRIFNMEKTVLIRSGFDTKCFMEARRETGRDFLNLDRDQYTIGMVACFKPQKSPLDFVRTAKHLKDSGRAFKYVLVGDGELRSEIMKEIVDLNLGKDFILPGWVENIEDVIASFDVMVLTSLWEGLPKVVPQALIAGVPVIATAVDGTVEVVKDGVNGYLIDVNSPGEAASKVIRVVEGYVDREGMNRMAEELRVEFSEGEMVRRHKYMYLRLLREKVWNR